MDKFNLQRLKGKANWTVWKLQIESNLQFHGYEGILVGDIAEPAPLAEGASAADKKEFDAQRKLVRQANGFAITLLSTTVDDDVLQLILMFKSAKEMWTKLVTTFEQKSEQRLEHLYLELLEYKKDPCDSVATHISRLQKLWIELNEESQRVDQCQLPKTLLIMRILSTLPSDYFEFRTTWESVAREERSIEYLLERLTMLESRLSKRGTEAESKDSALFGKGRKATKYPQKGASKFKSNDAEPTVDLSKVRCFSCKEFGHKFWKCPNKKPKPEKSTGTAAGLFGEALLTAVPESGVWIADSGATQHMTKCKEYFMTYTAFEEPKAITLGNKRTMLAYGKGDIPVEVLVNGRWVKNHLKDVWYTPEVVKNLFSLPSALDKGLKCWMDKGRCRLLKDDQTVVEGERQHGLYKLLLRPLEPETPAEVYVANKVDTLQVWHERLGHQSKQYVEKYLKKRDIKYIKDNQFCEGCVLGKQHRFSFGTRVNQVSHPGELIHADVCGPMQSESFSRCRYYVLFKDDFSKYRSVYFLKKKSEVVDKLQVFLAEAKTLGHTVKELLTDGGGEFDNKDVKVVTEKAGLHHRLTMAYTPEQNGSSERENRTLMEAARSMLQSKKLPNKLWAEAVNTAAHVLNRTGPTKVEDKTPYELWTGKEVTTNHFKVFGTECYVHVPKQNRQKLDAKAIKGYLVGYCDNKDGYRVYVPEKGTVVLSRDVIFKDEEITASEVEGSSVELSENLETCDESCQPPENQNKPVLRDRTQLKLPARYDDFAMLTFNEPSSFSEALRCDESHQWELAMRDEMQSLAENNTWELVEKPQGRKIVRNKWVYRVKTDLNGDVDKFKARLVAKGYSQEAGVDYTETFSPVARFDTIRAMLSVAASEKMELAHFDVKTAFLYGELDEEIFMHQPEGHEDGTSRVCKLKKSLYGLKQSPRCWNKKFTMFLEQQGLKQSEADPCLFLRPSTDGHKLMISLYVDDGLVVAQRKDDLDKFLDELKLQFKITVSAASCFLGLQIQKHEDGSIAISQENYVTKILEKFKMSDCNSVATPVDRSCDLSLSDSDFVGNDVPYREAVGSLMYLTVGTRPDIAFAVSLVSQALDCPTKNHWAMVKRILKYLKGTKNTGLLYKSDCESGILTAYCDADFAGDATTRRSTTGVVCQYMGAAISWLSQRQKSVALSTTEAEFIAASEATKDIVWLSRLLNELTVLKSTPILNIDNMSALRLVKNPVFHKRSKHIEVRHYFVREKYQEGKLDVVHVPSEEQIADIMTKSLPRCRFSYLRRKIGLCEVD